MESPFFDLHAHPAIKTSWFGKDLTQKHSLHSNSGILNLDPLGFNPFVVRTSFPKLKRAASRGDSFLLSAIYALEHRAVYKDLRIKTPLFSLPLISLLRMARIFPSFAELFKRYIEPDYFTTTLNTIETIGIEAEKDRNIHIAASAAELMQGDNSGGKIMLIHALEGAQSLEGEKTLEIQKRTGSRDGNPEILRPRTGEEETIIQEDLLSNLEALYNRGVAVIGLSHFYPNEVTRSCFSFPERTLGMVPHKSWKSIVDYQNKGLTRAGKGVIEKMLDLGILIDISHVSPKGRMEVFELVDARGTKQRGGEVIASHIGTRELHHHPYNLADWEIKWIADHGGVAGIIFSTYWLSGHGEAKLGLGYIEKTIDHMVNIGGEHAAAFGSDFDGFSDPPDDLADFSELHHLPDYLELIRTSSSAGIKRKYSSGQIEGFMWRNAFEAIRRGWGKRA
jgi:microsomal dipeptidase-like Zn-dependent dipeptidase